MLHVDISPNAIERETPDEQDSLFHVYTIHFSYYKTQPPWLFHVYKLLLTLGASTYSVCLSVTMFSDTMCNKPAQSDTNGCSATLASFLNGDFHKSTGF